VLGLMVVYIVASSYIGDMLQMDLLGASSSLKDAKYSILGAQYYFQPTALESLGPINCEACKFLSDLGRRISHSSGDD